MHNNYGLHELLYTGEHYTCNNYLSDIGIGFVYKEFDEGSQLHRNCFMQYNHLIFIIEGNCTVSCNLFTGRHFKSGEMVLIPRSSAFRSQADSPMKIIDMAFEVPIKRMRQAHPAQLFSTVPEHEIRFCPAGNSLSPERLHRLIGLLPAKRDKLRPFP